MIKKLKFLDHLANAKCTIILEQDGISEEGEPLTALTLSTKGIYTERVKRIIDATGKQITLNGAILIKGDIAPTLPHITSGECFINDRKYHIYAGYRVFNPDGSVNHSKLELI